MIKLTLHDELTALYLPQERHEEDKHRMLPAFDGVDVWHNISWLLDLNIWEDERDGGKAKAALYLVHNGSTLTEDHIAIQVEDKRTKPNLIDKVIEQIKDDLSHGDTSALAELLGFVPQENLSAYLPEK